MTTKNSAQTISAKIILQLQKNGMTLKQIGSIMGLSESYISYVKQGKRNLTIERLRKLEKDLKKPLPLIFLEATEGNLIPNELKNQYVKIRQVLKTI